MSLFLFLLAFPLAPFALLFGIKFCIEAKPGRAYVRRWLLNHVNVLSLVAYTTHGTHTILVYCIIYCFKAIPNACMCHWGTLNFKLITKFDEARRRRAKKHQYLEQYYMLTVRADIACTSNNIYNKWRLCVLHYDGWMEHLGCGTYCMIGRKPFAKAYGKRPAIASKSTLLVCTLFV